MRNWTTFLMTLIVGSTASYVNADMGQVAFEAGYRSDNITFNRTTNDGTNTTEVNRKFKDLDVFHIGLSGRTAVGGNFYGRAGLNYGWILDGDLKQSNAGTDATSLVSKNVIDNRFVFDANIAIGYPFYFNDCSVTVSPVVGYAFKAQHVRLEDARSTLNKFVTRYFGPFVGADFNYRPYNESWNIFAEAEYHFSRLHAKQSNIATQDLGQTTVANHSRARGWVFSVGTDYDLRNDWTVGLALKFNNRKSHKSHVTVTTRPEKKLVSDAATTQKFHAKNTNKWNSYAVGLTLGRQF